MIDLDDKRALVTGGSRDIEATLLLLSGQPIDESIVGHGPFVMNRATEISQTIADFNCSHFGQIAH